MVVLYQIMGINIFINMQANIYSIVGANFALWLDIVTARLGSLKS